MRALLRGHPADDSAVLGALNHWLAEHPQLRTLASYAALPGEIDLLPLLAAHPDRRWVFPRVSGEALSLHVIRDPLTGFRTGAWGILEPAPDAPEAPPAEVDAFLCPGLAFDPAGGRLGRGRGYYDRLLAAARPDALKLGVCRSFQLVDATFSEPHDIAMDRIISG
jgi:5-formyltetrahydrofolate cyclo-ligase